MTATRMQTVLTLMVPISVHVRKGTLVMGTHVRVKLLTLVNQDDESTCFIVSCLSSVSFLHAFACLVSFSLPIFLYFHLSFRLSLLFFYFLFFAFLVFSNYTALIP